MKDVQYDGIQNVIELSLRTTSNDSLIGHLFHGLDGILNYGDPLKKFTNFKPTRSQNQPSKETARDLSSQHEAMQMLTKYTSIIDLKTPDIPIDFRAFLYVEKVFKYNYGKTLEGLLCIIALFYPDHNLSPLYRCKTCVNIQAHVMNTRNTLENFYFKGLSMRLFKEDHPDIFKISEQAQKLLIPTQFKIQTCLNFSSLWDVNELKNDVNTADIYQWYLPNISQPSPRLLRILVLLQDPSVSELKRLATKVGLSKEELFESLCLECVSAMSDPNAMLNVESARMCSLAYMQWEQALGEKSFFTLSTKCFSSTFDAGIYTKINMVDRNLDLDYFIESFADIKIDAAKNVCLEKELLYTFRSGQSLKQLQENQRKFKSLRDTRDRGRAFLKDADKTILKQLTEVAKKAFTELKDFVTDAEDDSAKKALRNRGEKVIKRIIKKYRRVESRQYIGTTVNDKNSRQHLNVYIKITLEMLNIALEIASSKLILHRNIFPEVIRMFLHFPTMEDDSINEQKHE